MNHRATLIGGMIVLLLWLSGCASTPREPIPTYPMMNAAQASATMNERNAKIESVSGSGAVTMTDPKGQSVRFDAAFAFAPPGSARIRAYKFGQAVLDLTVKSEDVWVYLPRNDGRRESIREASRSIAGAVDLWMNVLAGGASFGRWETSGGKFVVTDPDGRKTTRLEIDRATLTARRCVTYDDAGRERFVLTLDRYGPLGEAVWPGRAVAKSDAGTILIEMRDVELNGAPPAAFQPPPRAERLP